MKTCENCGAALDVGERCDCADSVKAALADPETAELIQTLKRLPERNKREILFYAKGQADTLEAMGLLADKAV